MTEDHLSELEARARAKVREGAAYIHMRPSEVLQMIETERRLRASLERLGSMEAFTVSRSIDHKHDSELLARIDFARLALNPQATAEGMGGGR